MKHIFALGAATLLVGAFAFPALAFPVPPHCTITGTTQQALNNLPPECLLADTKDKHPLWYRDGGYCDGGTTVTQSISSSETCFEPPV